MFGIRDNSVTPIEVTIGDLVTGIPDDLDDATPKQIERLDGMFDEAGEIDESESAAATTLPEAPIRLNVPHRIPDPWHAQ